LIVHSSKLRRGDPNFFKLGRKRLPSFPIIMFFFYLASTSYDLDMNLEISYIGDASGVIDNAGYVRYTSLNAINELMLYLGAFL